MGISRRLLTEIMYRQSAVAGRAEPLDPPLPHPGRGQPLLRRDGALDGAATAVSSLRDSHFHARQHEAAHGSTKSDCPNRRGNGTVTLARDGTKARAPARESDCPCKGGTRHVAEQPALESGSGADRPRAADLGLVSLRLALDRHDRRGAGLDARRRAGRAGHVGAASDRDGAARQPHRAGPAAPDRPCRRPPRRALCGARPRLVRHDRRPPAGARPRPRRLRLVRHPDLDRRRGAAHPARHLPRRRPARGAAPAARHRRSASSSPSPPSGRSSSSSCARG